MNSSTLRKFAAIANAEALLPAAVLAENITVTLSVLL